MEKENDYLEAVNDLKKQYDTCKSNWEEKEKKLLQKIIYLEDRIKKMIKLVSINGTISGVYTDT